MSELIITLPPANWQRLDSGRATAARQMEIDCALLENFNTGDLKDSLIRWYGWERECATFGKNQDEELVRQLVGPEMEISRRPTGGGICIHGPDDSAVSIFIPRKMGLGTVRLFRRWLRWELSQSMEADILPRGNGLSPWCDERFSGEEIVKDGRKILALSLLSGRSVFLLQGNMRGDHTLKRNLRAFRRGNHAGFLAPNPLVALLSE